MACHVCAWPEAYKASSEQIENNFAGNIAWRSFDFLITFISI